MKTRITFPKSSLPVIDEYNESPGSNWNCYSQKKFLPIASYLQQSNSIEELFKLLRKKHNLSQKTVAKIISSTPLIVSLYENNHRDLRTCEILALARYNDDFRLGAIAFLERLKSD